MAVGGVDRKFLVLDFLRVLLLYIQFLQKKITEQYQIIELELKMQ
jgi:hypothetical protein